MPTIKNFKKAKKKILEISARFDLSKREKETKSVQMIVDAVRKSGDRALIYYTRKFDKVNLRNILVKKSEIKSSTKFVSRELLNSIKKAIKRIKKFQQINVPKTWIKSFKSGEKLGYRYVPLDSVGIYIPGGKNPLISTVLMTVIPAKVARVKRIAIFSPPPIHRGILATCKLLGVHEIYQIGGAQAIAAGAYGAESVKPVDKIIGPGNIYVTLAKKNAFGKVGIDGLYGPSEIAIIADKSANPDLLAIDLLSQLEHGSGLESAVLITNNLKLAKEVERKVYKLVQTLPNKKVVIRSWKKNSTIIVCNLNRGVDLINLLAPEHLEIITKKPGLFLSKIKNAGAVFLGHYSCEAIGDYVAGPSHCLPTGGSARFSSGLTVSDFMKKISVISFDKKSFTRVAKDVIELANVEKLKAHADSIQMRNDE